MLPLTRVPFWGYFTFDPQLHGPLDRLALAARGWRRLGRGQRDLRRVASRRVSAIGAHRRRHETVLGAKSTRIDWKSVCLVSRVPCLAIGARARHKSTVLWLPGYLTLDYGSKTGMDGSAVIWTGLWITCVSVSGSAPKV